MVSYNDIFKGHGFLTKYLSTLFYSNIKLISSRCIVLLIDDQYDAELEEMYTTGVQKIWEEVTQECQSLLHIEV